jgi:hypothetical protein
VEPDVIPDVVANVEANVVSDTDNIHKRAEGKVLRLPIL